MRSLLALPLALLNGPIVWGLGQVTHFDVSLADAVAVGGVASIVPSLFMVWAGMTAKKMYVLHKDHVTKMEPWREDVLQRIKGLETVVRNCDVSEFREEILEFLNRKTDEYQVSFSNLELRVVELEQEGR